MSGQKPNRRVQFTKTSLHRALVDLAMEKPLHSITVKDLCARADINRSTFYLHYKDAHALIQEIENMILERIGRLINTEMPLNDPRIVTSLLEIKNSPHIRAMMRALLSDQGDPQFLNRLQKVTYDSFSRKWEEQIPASHEKVKPLVYAFLAAGITAALVRWIEGDSPDVSAEEAVQLLCAMMQYGVSRFGFDLPEMDELSEQDATEN